MSNPLLLKPFWITRWLSPLALAVALAGCTYHIKVNPVAVSGDTVMLRGPQSITLKNGYSSESKIVISKGMGLAMDADLMQLTDAAITMMSRHLGKNGIAVGGGEKTITLRVRDLKANIFSYSTTTYTDTFLNLEAQMGDGTVSMVPAQNRSTKNPPTSIEGALLFSVTGLLNDARFVGYVNH